MCCSRKRVNPSTISKKCLIEKLEVISDRYIKLSNVRYGSSPDALFTLLILKESKENYSCLPIGIFFPFSDKFITVFNTVRGIKLISVTFNNKVNLTKYPAKLM